MRTIYFDYDNSDLLFTFYIYTIKQVVTPNLYEIMFAEKHKTYHIKDEQLARDGFKKYMKNEPCPYRDCRYITLYDLLK